MSGKDKKDQGEAPPAGSVLPRRPTARPKQGTAAFPVAQRSREDRPPEDSWAEAPASDPIEIGESVSDEPPPPKGATLRTAPDLFVDQLAPAPADARVDIGGLVKSVAGSDPALAAEISGDYAGVNADESIGEPADESAYDDTTDATDAGEPADDLIEEEEEDTSVDSIGQMNVDDALRRALGECDDVIAAGPAPVSDLSEEQTSAEEEEDKMTKDTNPVDPHAPTTASKTVVPVAEPASADPVEKPATDEASAPKAEANVPPALPAPVEPAPLNPVPAKGATPAVAAVPAKGATPAKPATPDKGPVKSKHEATTAAIPAEKTTPPMKMSRAAKVAAVMLLLLALVALVFVGWWMYPIAKPNIDKAMTALLHVSPVPARTAEPRSVELSAKDKAAISAFAKKAAVPVKMSAPIPPTATPDAKPASETPALPTTAAANDSAVAMLMAVDEFRKKTIAPDNGWEPVNANSPIAKFIENDGTATWPKKIEDCLPATSVVLDELDVVRCCLRLPTSQASAACVTYSSRLVLVSENAMPY